MQALPSALPWLNTVLPGAEVSGHIGTSAEVSRPVTRSMRVSWQSATPTKQTAPSVEITRYQAYLLT